MQITPQIHTLPNGIRVILVPMSETDVVSTNIIFDVGSRYETPEIAGVAHFLEHMAFKGTVNRPTTFLITKEIDAVGGNFNAATNKDYTQYYINMPSRHQNVAYDLLSDMLLNSLYDAAEIEREKGPITEEIKMYYDEPSRLRFLELDRLTYGDTPLGWDIGGTLETVAGMTREDITGFYHRYYNPDNTYVVVSGKIDPVETLHIITEKFSAVPKKNSDHHAPYVHEQQSPRIKLTQRAIEQANPALTFVTHGRKNSTLSDMFARGILADILGGYSSSQLVIEIRERHGLVYYIDTAIGPLEEIGEFIIYAGCSPQNLIKMLELTFETLRNAKEKGFSEEEISRAKENNIGRLIMGSESAYNVGRNIGFDVKDYGRYIPMDEKVALINAVTNEQLMRIAREIFRPENLNFVSVGPNKAEEADQLLAAMQL